MNWQAISFDWNQVRAFLATVEEGSFSAAARATHQTQPTLGRQIASLEDHLGVTLFERTGRSVILTEAGARLVDHVRDMADAATRLSLTASGQATSVEGLVRISTSDVFAVYILPHLLTRLARDAPGISVEVVASNAISDLQRREADIAIRHIRPTQPDLIARKIGNSEARLYVTPEFLRRNGPINGLDDLNGLNFISFGPPEEMVHHLNPLGFALTAQNFKYYSENGMAGWAMVRAGLGVGIMTTDVGRETPEVELLLPDQVQVSVPVWLATHRELQTSARIRCVFDALADVLSERLA